MHTPNSPYRLMHLTLRDWYHAHGRVDLPWRNTNDAYAIYISEIMLQQTQVQTVLARFYTPFLSRFPTLIALSNATLEDVLTVWQGLGYYRRAAHLHEAAKRAAPQLPTTISELMALPGIGQNTAHAIAAFAYRQPVPVMEANVKRILYRVFALREATDSKLWELAYQLVDTEDPFTYNQAMMDIGATVCTNSKPACMMCPLQSVCQGRVAPEMYPAAKKKKAVPTHHKSIVAFHTEDLRFHLTPRTTRFLHGLYGFTEYDKAVDMLAFAGKTYPLADATCLGDIVQHYSHFTLQATIYGFQIPASLANSWYTLAEIEALPLSRADSKVLALLKNTYKKEDVCS